MAEQFLSQDEIDALLDGPEQSEDNGQVDDGGAPRSYDLAHQERIVRGRMPTLELIHERFARNLRIGIFKLMRRNPEVVVGPIGVGKYSAFIDQLEVPTSINVMNVQPLHGNALLVIEPKLILGIIDLMFGGSGTIQTRIEGRDFSATELRIIQRIIEMICTEYRQAWEGVHPIELSLVRSEMQPQFASVANPSEIVVTSRFDIELGETGGTIQFCIPYVVLEPIRELLFSSLNTRSGANDQDWQSVLSQEIRPTEVELVAELASTELTLGELINLSVGDIIAIDLFPQARVKVGQVAIFEGKHGLSGKRHAVRLDEVLSPSLFNSGTPA